MKNILMVLATLVCATALGATHYVVPGGTGDGSSWANGASLDSALAAVADGDVVLLRQGVHVVSAGVTLANLRVTLRGGYAVGDADGAPSGDKHATVITADADLDNVWVSFDPETSTKSFVLENGEPMKVVKNGALNLPPDYTGKYQVYYPAEVGAGGAIVDPVGLVGAFITFTGTASCDISNVTFSGFGDTTSSGTSPASVLAWPPTTLSGNVASSVRQVAFVGNAAKGSLVGCHGNNTANQPCGDYTDVDVKFCRLNTGSAIVFSNWVQPPSFTNCVFESIYGENALRSFPMALNLLGRPSKANVQGCAFRRLVHVAGANWSVSDTDFISNGNPNPVGVAMAFGTGTFFIRNCDVDRCWADNNRATTLALLEQNANVRNLRIRENYVKITCTRHVRASLGGLVTVGMSGAPIVDNGLFVSNRMEVATAVPTASSGLPTEIYAAPVMVYGVRMLFGDCIFADNSVDLSAVEIDTVKMARSVMAVNNKANGLPSVDCVHCTFTGSAAGDDFVLTKTLDYGEFYATLRMAFFDCILWSGAHDYTYAGATVDGQGQPADCVTLQRCIVKNAGKLASGVNFVDCTADDSMLAYDPATGVPRPTVAVPGVQGHPQAWYLTVLNKGAPLFRDGCDMSTTNMYLLTVVNPANKTLASPLMSRRASGGNYAINASNVTEKPDLLGQLRPADQATAGAVQTTLPAGRVLSAEAHPAGSGYVTIGSQYAGVDGFAEVTAVSTDPSYTFQKWVDEGGNTLSTSATYKCPSAADFTRIRAVFGAPQATWTFNVDSAKGVFTNGATTIVMTLTPGDDSPAYPEVRAAPAWHQTGWDRAIPASVGSSDLEFNVTFIPYTKVVYFDSQATGANDGTSWADAFTKFSTAVSDAGGNNSYVGEVRVRQGRHLIPNNQHQSPFKNVKIIGGWTGNGDERSTDRRLTVFTGDINDDDVFVDQHGNTVGKVYANGRFIDFRPPTEAEGYWELANHTENYSQILTKDDSIACTNARIEGCTFYGFYSPQFKLISSGKYLNVTITNCDFIALHQVYQYSQGQVELGAASRVLDCAFYGLTGAGFYLNAPALDEVFEFRNVKNLYSTRNVATSRFVTFINQNKGAVRAEDIEVGYVQVGNYTDGTGNANTAAAIIFQDTYNQGATVPCWIKNGYFHDISSPLNDRPTTLLQMSYAADAAILENCVFENIKLGAFYDSTKAVKMIDVIQVQAKTITNCVFRNVSFDFTGEAAGGKYAALVNVMGGIYGTTFENCRLSSTQDNYSFFLMSRGGSYIELGDGTSFVDCSVTNTGASVTATAAFSVAGLVGGRAINMNSSPYRAVGKVLVKDCSVCAPNKWNAFLVDDLGRGVVANGLTVVNNTVEGGTALAGVLRACTAGNLESPQTNPGTTLINTTVAGNTVVSEAPIVATVYRANFPMTIGWSTFCGNDVPCESYIGGNYKLNLTSSVMTSDAGDWTAHRTSSAASTANGIVFANSYAKGIDSTSSYFSGENAFTAIPRMTGVVWNRRQRLFGVYHTPQSPYAKRVELAGVYAEEAATDAAGVARPSAGPVLIGAMQNTYSPPGVMLLVK